MYTLWRITPFARAPVLATFRHAARLSSACPALQALQALQGRKACPARRGRLARKAYPAFRGRSAHKAHKAHKDSLVRRAPAASEPVGGCIPTMTW